MRRSDQRRAAVFVCYQRDLTNRPLQGLIEQAARDRDLSTTAFTRELVEGTEANIDELDGIIAQHAIDWTLERIAPLERCILRVALYEIAHRDDVPTEVAIDEAVELAKEYCGTNAPAFINGILGAAVKDLPDRH